MSTRRYVWTLVAIVAVIGVSDAALGRAHVGPEGAGPLAALRFDGVVSAQEERLIGTYEGGPISVTFEEDSRYRISLGGEVIITGRYRATEEELSLEDLEGPLACLGNIGKYEWRLTQDQLELRVVEDECSERSEGLTRGALLRGGTKTLLALTHATLIDGNGGQPQQHMTVLIEGDQIAKIFTTGSQTLPEAADVRDLSGKYVIPGLIDAHVHLATDPSGGDNHETVREDLRLFLSGGVTSVRDMAGDARSLAFLARAALLDEIESPRIYYSAIIGGPGLFSDERAIASSRGVKPGDGPWARAVTAESDLVRVIAEAKGTGATAIKMYALLSADLVRRLAEEAHRQGMQVWSHVHVAPAKPSDAVAAGVDVLSHVDGLLAEAMDTDDPRPNSDVEIPDNIENSPHIDALLQRMREQGTILDATLSVYADPEGVGGEDGEQGERVRLAYVLVRKAHQAGVLITAGTDTPNEGALPRLHEELEMLVEKAGMTPSQALTSATKVNAESIGIDETHGTLEEGKVADIVILGEDPTTDIRNTGSIIAVIKGGRIYESDPSSP